MEIFPEAFAVFMDSTAIIDLAYSEFYYSLCVFCSSNKESSDITTVNLLLLFLELSHLTFYNYCMCFTFVDMYMLIFAGILKLQASQCP